MNEKKCKSLRKIAQKLANKLRLPRTAYKVHAQGRCIMLSECERKIYQDLKNARKG